MCAELKGPVGNIVHYERTVLSVEQNKVLIPPTYNRYLSWGFSDLSVRVGNYDSDKACAIYENLDNGDILCAACPNARMVVTAGTSTVSFVTSHMFLRNGVEQKRKDRTWRCI